MQGQEELQQNFTFLGFRLKKVGRFGSWTVSGVVNNNEP